MGRPPRTNAKPKRVRPVPETSRHSVVRDAESRGGANGHQDLRLWLRTMAIYKLVTNEIRRRLRLNFDMSLARFDLMAQLEHVGHGMRMGEVTSRLMATTGNTTGLVDELVSDGLVERMQDPRSRRAFLVRLTPKGRKVFGVAAKAHRKWIVEFYRDLSEEQKRVLFEILGHQKASVREELAIQDVAAKPGARSGRRA